MSDIVIRAERLSKLYKIGVLKQRHDTLRDQLVHSFKSLFSGNRHHPPQPSTPPSIDGRPDIIWALKGFSFEVRQGEVVGIIGRNAAGKSTLLKILSRITEPTSGRAEIHGRVGSLLEVGTGFHPELTGRDNIYLNGAMLGMRKREINHKFDEIVAFAEIERFIDTPVKRYSSGMYVRLAFAVAAHLEPEILIVDEVLAVGDAVFQKKCLGKMDDVAKEGRTVLFVSHNSNAILRLCQKVVVIAGGKVDYIGNPSEGIEKYGTISAAQCAGVADLSSHPNRRHGCVPVLKKVRLLNASGMPKDRFMCGESIKIEFTIDPKIPYSDLQFGIGVDDSLGARIFSLTTEMTESRIPPLREWNKIICHVRELPLAPGRYTLSFSAGTEDKAHLDAVEHAISFEVDPRDFFGNGKTPPNNLGRVLIRSWWNVLECDASDS